MWTARLLVLASLFAPAALGEFGSLQLLCVSSVFVSAWSCRCGRKKNNKKNTPLPFHDWQGLKPHQNCILSLFKRQVAIKAFDFMSLCFSASIELSTLISSFDSLNSPKLFLHFSYLHSLSVSFSDLLPIFRSVPLSLVSVSCSRGDRK